MRQGPGARRRPGGALGLRSWAARALSFGVKWAAMITCQGYVFFGLARSLAKPPNIVTIIVTSQKISTMFWPCQKHKKRALLAQHPQSMKSNPMACGLGWGHGHIVQWQCFACCMTCGMPMGACCGSHFGPNGGGGKPQNFNGNIATQIFLAANISAP